MKLYERLAWIFTADLPAPVKSVLLVLAFHADRDDRSWPRQGLIAQESGLSRHTVINALKVLRKILGSDDLPVLSEARRFHRSTVYTLHLQCSPDELLDVHQMNKGSIHRTTRLVRLGKSKRLSQTAVSALWVTLGKDCSICGVRKAVADGLCGPCIRNRYRDKVLAAKEKP